MSTSALPSSPARIADPTVCRGDVLWSDEEQAALRVRTLTPAHGVLAVLFAAGVALTLATIKLTTGVPIDRDAERVPVQVAALSAWLESHPLDRDEVACVLFADAEEPSPSALAPLATRGRVLPASWCGASAAALAMDVHHVHWQWGGRAIVFLGRGGQVEIHLQRRLDGWRVVAMDNPLAS